MDASEALSAATPAQTRAPTSTQAPAWTCPFCALLCDGFALDAAGAHPPRLVGSSCTRAMDALAGHAPRPGAAPAWVDGGPASLDAAVQAAAQRLRSWRQPLFGGMGTDIAGARALYRLAARSGAIADHADGDGLFRGLRALQDRGQYTVTLADVRTRAAMLVFVGTDGSGYPELLRRCGVGADGSPCREIVVVGAPPMAASVPVHHVAGSGDLLADVQRLAAAIDGRVLSGIDPALVDLARRLADCPYAVWVVEPGALPAHGALAIELVNRVVGLLNRTTRAAMLLLGGNDGAASANQAFTWLSGLPLRTRVAAGGLRHEPHLFATSRGLAGRAVDGLLWVSSFRADRLPPAAEVPRVVLGPPAMADRLFAAGGERDTVFIAVATPGLNATGHLFRTDGPIVLPLQAARDDGLPGVAQVAEAIQAQLGAGA